MKFHGLDGRAVSFGFNLWVRTPPMDFEHSHNKDGLPIFYFDLITCTRISNTPFFKYMPAGVRAKPDEILDKSNHKTENPASASRVFKVKPYNFLLSKFLVFNNALLRCLAFTGGFN